MRWKVVDVNIVESQSSLTNSTKDSDRLLQSEAALEQGDNNTEEFRLVEASSLKIKVDYSAPQLVSKSTLDTLVVEV